jgi:hypothetical protein
VRGNGQYETGEYALDCNFAAITAWESSKGPTAIAGIWNNESSLQAAEPDVEATRLSGRAR